MNSTRSLVESTFARDGFLIVRGMVDEQRCAAMRSAVVNALEPIQGPAEFEAEVGYPGAPSSRSAEGGETPRRLLNAYSRDPLFRAWATDPSVQVQLSEMIGEDDIFMSQCHHNCVMTKQPGYSSRTAWHQDVRYWSFDRPELVSVWLALGHENETNGALSVIPGTHVLNLDRGRFDQHLFLRPELEQNQALIEQAVTVLLDPGDVLFFHCRLFHAAGMNRSEAVKLSVVHTYHSGMNHPIPGTRSAQYPSIPLRPPAR